MYTKTMSGTREVREYVDGYIMREVGDTDSFEVSGLTPAKQSITMWFRPPTAVSSRPSRTKWL